MSDVGLGATLQLDIADALARIEQVGVQLAAATTGIAVTLDQPDASPVTASIDGAVQAADTTVTTEADSGAVTTSIDEAVGAADVTVPVSADTTPAEGEIAALDTGLPDLTVGVDADTTPAVAAVAEVVSVADAEVATVTVEADTTQADQSIADVGATADSSSAGVDKLTGSLGALKGSTADVTGLAAGLGSVVGDALPASFAGATLAVGGFVGITKGLFDAGVTAIAAEQRLTIATGEFKDKVEQIHVGTLSTDIKGLADATGSTVVPIENAVSRIFTLGKTSGESGDSIAQTSGRILALAGDLRSTNPSLGETGDIADRLTQALARGGRSLANFGISLSATQINQEALNETGKKSSAELTNYEKSAAAAKLATDQLGSSFQANFAAGANNPVIQIGQIKAQFVALFEELGKPLVAPVIDLLRDLVPLGEGVGRSLGSIAQAIVPIADVIANVLGPPLSLLATILGAIPPQAIEVVGGLLLVSEGVAGLAAALLALSASNPVLAGLEVVVGAIAAAVGVYRALTGSSSNDQLLKDTKSESAALTDQTGILQLTTKALQDYIDKKDEADNGKFSKALKDLGLTIDDVTKDILAGKTATEAFAGAQSASFVHTKEAIGGYDQLAASTAASADKALTAAVASGVLTQAQVDTATATGGSTRAYETFLPVITAHQIAVSAAADAYAPLITAATDGAASLAALTATSPEAGAALAGLAASGIHPTNDALVTFALGMDHASLTTKQLDLAAAALGITSGQLTGFLNGVSGALNSFVSKVVAGLPSVADAFKPVSTSAGSAGGAMQNAASQALQAQRSIESAQHGIVIANRGVVDSADALVKANAGVQTSVDALTTAQKNLADAEQALADARNPAKPKDLEQANINLERAQLNAAKAVDAVTTAEQGLDAARSGQGTVTIHQAEQTLEDARLSQRESVIRVSDAEDALNTVRQVGTEADKNVVTAEKAVETARTGVTTATAGIITAQHQVEIAHRAVADAAYAAVSAEQALQQALIKPAASGGGGGATKQAAVTLAEFVTNLETSTTKTQRFADDIKTIFDATAADGTHKFTELAGEIAQFGIGAITVADQAAQGIRTGNTALVDSAEKDVKTQNKALSDMENFAKNVFGPAYIATTGLIANLASQAFGTNLSFASKLKLQLAETTGVLDVQGTAIALIAGEKGNEAAVQYAKNNNIEERTLDAGLAAAKILADNKELPKSAGDLATIASGQFHDVLVKGLPAGVTAAAIAATTSPGDDAALRLFYDLGTSMTEGIHAGVVGKAAVAGLNNAAIDVVRGAWSAASGPKGANTGSPSKLFAALGRDMAAGLTMGLEDSADPVVLAAEQIVKDAAAKIQTTLDAQTFGFGATTGSNLRDLLATPAVVADQFAGSSQGVVNSGAFIIQGGVTVQVQFTGPVDQQTAEAAGKAAGSAFLDQIAAKNGAKVALRQAGVRI